MKNKIALILGSTALVVTSTVLMISAQSASALSLQSVVTGLCLDGDSRNVGPEAPSNTGTVYTNPCKSSNPYQKWNLLQNGGNSITLTHSKTGFCLTAVPLSVLAEPGPDGPDIFLSTCDGSDYQRWFFSSNRTPNDNRSDGKWKNVATGRCLDNDNNRKVYLLECKNQYAGQNWGSR
jgi:Ricin-type beta-trefoil lectin domain